MLKPRMQAIADLVPRGSILADIGTDHGLIPIYLIKEDICKSVIACDINIKPLNVCIKNIRAENLQDKITTRISDGLEKISPDECDVISIAGMGGHQIINILDIKFNNHILILQPMTSPALVRRFLYENDFNIIKEEIVYDNDILYIIIMAKKGRDKINRYDYYISDKTLENGLAGEYTGDMLLRANISLESAEKSEKITDKILYLRNKVEKLKLALENL